MKKLRVFLCAFAALLLGCALILPIPSVAKADRVDEYVYVGGFPVGISLDVEGLLVEDVTGVETEYGTASVEGLRTGDIIKKIDGEEVDSAEDIGELLSSSPAEIELVRGGDTVTVQVRPIIEAYTLKPKLGVKIKDTVYGVGTVTFVREDGTFAALGHEISGDGGTRIPFNGGAVHACKIVGVKRGTRAEAGSLVASLSQDRVLGSVSCNNSFGIAGELSERGSGERLPIASRDEVRSGAAEIKTTVGGEAEYFDVEIIKAVKQSSRKEKGMILRVTDKRLLDMTGGVVRGMSGSPIIQNGKLVGAVTHVFLNDHTKGYGVYADFLN